MRYRVFPDVNRIGRPKAVTSIPILLTHYRQLPLIINFVIFIFEIQIRCYGCILGNIGLVFVNRAVVLLREIGTITPY